MQQRRFFFKEPIKKYLYEKYFILNKSKVYYRKIEKTCFLKIDNIHVFSCNTQLLVFKTYVILLYVYVYS